MTTSSGEPPMTRVQTFVSHSVPWLLTVAIVTRVLFMVGLIPHVIDTLVFLLLFIGWCTLRYHWAKARLCLRCIRGVPLDPGTEVKRHLWLLRIQHWGPMRTSLVFGGVLAFTLILPYLVHISKDSLVDRGALVPLDVVLFVSLFSSWIHHRLQPWCPYCKPWGEGGEEELVPGPDPDEDHVPDPDPQFKVLK